MLLYEVAYRLILIYHRYDNRYGIASVLHQKLCDGGIMGRMRGAMPCLQGVKKDGRKAGIQKPEPAETARPKQLTSDKGERRESATLTEELANRILRLAPTYNGGWQNPLER